ncbi:excisionase [Ramlibacter sp. RBP-2]|uniref:Excisionase n=1 Tax=Ramlibacter lithotrophicus TaxID=2606681 RepID=A0A7X6DKM4_9BURK|nr:excisionase [Ramlibacter lithotrophicus]
MVRTFCLASGYSPKAVYRKIERGDWVQGREYRKAPDGRILIDYEGVQRWITGLHRAASN